MEARDSGSKIRPLPIDDIDGGPPQDRPHQQKRRWLPLIVIVAGALAFGVVARGLGPGNNLEVATASTAAGPISESVGLTTTTTTTTEPAPSPLHQLLPLADEGMRLVTVTNTFASVGKWSPESAVAEFNARITQPRSASYNVDGTLVAIHTWQRDGSLVIDSADSGSPVYIQGDISSGVWHPTDPDIFAWTQIDNESSIDQTIIKVANVSGFSGMMVEPLVELAVARSNHELQAWGDWGFVTSSSGSVFVFDSDGQELRRVDGAFFDATTDGVLLLARTDEDTAMPYLLNPDGAVTELVGLDIGASDLRLTDDGGWVVAVTHQADGHTSILARTVHSRSTRLTSIDETARIVDLLREDRFLVLQEVHSKDLVFKDWDTGAEFRVPMDSDVAAVFL